MASRGWVPRAVPRCAGTIMSIRIDRQAVSGKKENCMATATDNAALERWERENAAAPTREQPPTTVSSVPIEALYTPESLNGFDPEVDLGFPGQYPFARGVHASMYRSRLWTM